MCQGQIQCRNSGVGRIKKTHERNLDPKMLDLLYVLLPKTMFSLILIIRCPIHKFTPDMHHVRVYVAGTSA